MAKITLKGNPINTIGELPKIGEKAKDFNLVKFLKANKLGSYGMINENYVDLHAVNNPLAEDFDSNENLADEDDDMEFVAQMKKRNRGGDEMDAVSRAEGIVDDTCQ